MKTGKRVLSIFLVVLILLTAAPLAGLVGLDLRSFDFGCMKAAAETFYSGIFKYTLNSDNEATITGSIFTKVEELTGHLSIPATIDGYPVISVGGFSKFKNLTSVSIAAGVQTIKSSAFKGTNIASVNLGTVSKIEGSAFLGCPITNIDLSYVTSLSAGAFGNTQITYVSIPIALTSIGVGTKGGPFYGSRLSSYYLENSPSRIIKGLFAGCNELKSVEIQDSIKTIEEAAFYKCEGLETVTGMKNVTRIDALAFASCKMLKNLPHMNNLSSLGAGAFVGDTSLTDFFVPSSLTTVSANYSVVGIGMDTDTGAFQSTSLKNVTFDASMTRIPSKLFFRCDSLEEITIPDSITVIESAAFYKCSSLMEVFGARNVSSIGELAFGLCSSLQEFPRLSKLEKIGGAAFYHDSALTSFFIPKALCKCGFGYNVVSIGTGSQAGIFEGSGLVDVSFDDSMTTIPAGLFLECTSLETITLPKSITTVEELAFFKCTNLQKVEGFENVESFGHMAFYLCSSLTELPLNAAIKTIGSGAFAQTQGVEEVVIPKSLSKITSGYNIVGLASGTIFPFQNSGLKCVTFEDGYQVIQSGLLRRCRLMEKTIIPNTVTKIESSAFAECVLLSDVYYGGTETEWNAITIGTNNDNLKNATIHFNSSGEEPPEPYIDEYIEFPENYSFTKDSYSFSNDWAYPTYKHYANLFNPAKAFLLYLSHKKIGLCFGMSYTTAAFFNGFPNVSCFYKENSTDNTASVIRELGRQSELVKGSSSLENKRVEDSFKINDYALYAQLYQFSAQVSKMEKQTMNKIGELYNTVKAYTKANKLGVTIGMNMRKSSDGHRVLAVGIEGKNILVYDPNDPTTLKKIVINGDKWLFGIGTYNSESADIMYNTDILEPYRILTGTKFLAPAKTNKSVENLKLDTGYYLLKIEADKFNLDTDKYYEIHFAEGLEQEDDSPFFWLENNNTVCISDVENGGRITTAADDTILVTSSEKKYSVEMSLNETEDIILNTEKDSKVSFSFSTVDEELNEERVSISGIANIDKVLVSKTEDGYQVSGLNDISVVYYQNDEVKAKTDAEVKDGREVIITVSDNGDAVSTDFETIHTHADDNNNGKCDTCGEKMTGGKHCKYCGKIHGGAFGWLVKFFHSIFAIFKR